MGHCLGALLNYLHRHTNDTRSQFTKRSSNHMCNRITRLRLPTQNRRQSGRKISVSMFINDKEDSACISNFINGVPEGALPIDTLPIPLYIFLHPPLGKNPPGACRRVLMVSMGKRERSTATPAKAPAVAATGSIIVHEWVRKDP